MARPLGIELWVTGTRSELDWVLAILRTNGRLLQHGEPIALTGEDRGRYRQYLRFSGTTNTADTAAHQQPPAGRRHLQAVRGVAATTAPTDQL